jgi:hypothetical protein
VAAGGDRLWPYWLERQRDPASSAFVALPGDTGVLPNVTGRSWTLVGTRSGADLAAVDPRGLVTPVPGGWSLDWWVGADDRWHLPSREVAVRQRLVDGAPVVETAMRVPGGDVVATAWAAQASSADGGAEVVVVEVSNATPVPVALAFAVRPYDAEGVTSVRSVALRDARVDVDGRPALLLPRPPARAVVRAFGDGDPVGTVVAGEAQPVPGGGAAVRCRAGLASAAFVVPLTHGTSVRVVLAADRSGRPLPPPGSLPPPAAVARGWRTHVDAGARVVLPDDRLQSAVDTSHCSLLLAAHRDDDVAAVSGALDELGHPDEARSLLLRALDGPVRAVDGAVLAALDRHLSLAPDPALAERTAPTVAAVADRLARDGGSPHLAAAARILRLAGEDAAAAAAFRSAGARREHPGSGTGDERRPALVLRQAAGEVERGDDAALERLRWALDAASPTGAWPDEVHPRLGTGCAGDGHSLVAAAELLRAVRRLLVSEDGDGLVLCPLVPEHWHGRGLEAHGLPTPAGTLSFAVRWHGSRPALLWELDGAGPVRLRAPGLDDAWSTGERRGEALLAGPSAGVDVQGGSFS